MTNVKDYGAKGDGVTDDTAAVNAAIAAAAAKGGFALFPASLTSYVINGTLSNPQRVPLWLYGQARLSGAGAPTLNLFLLTGSGQTFTVGGQTNIIDSYIGPEQAGGSNQQVGVFIDLIGGTSLGGTGKFRIPLVARAQTGGASSSADGLDAINIIVQQNAADAVAYLNGLELSFNNLKRNDPLNPVDQNHYGITVDAYGGFSIGPAAVAIRTAAVNSTWQRGIWIPVNTVTAGGYAFDYEGNGGGAVRITAAGLLSIGGTAGTGIQFANGSTLQDDGSNNLTMKGGSAGVRILNQAASLANLTVTDAGAVTARSSVQVGTSVFASLPASANGAIFYCSDCDPPTAVDNTCTSAGTRTGAIALRVNGAWKCVG